MTNSSQAPFRYWKTITASDTALLPQVAGTMPRAIRVGVAGNVALEGQDGVSVTFTAVPVGVMDVQPLRLKATGTTATTFTALY